ncbi:L-type lectin-domain containing receptor kinase IV.1 [Dichanthelium oligosanthes]|uniref:non-specific serine/threonine protein kinase n=1 Tax=Dichanthelium oligosanthes TaxID=888268 RepID=A0A1E5VIT6_9POAL|nr:L-type lectin-domain containing receptor kinase IV.1 [Dichanthelium oligosanthes]
MAAAVLAAVLVAVLLLLARGGPAAADGADMEFLFTGFAPGNVTTTGAAVVTSSGLLQLTNETNEVFGHGFYPVPVRFRDASTGAPISFSTTFVVAIVPRHDDAHGHGIAFALAPSITVPGAVAGKNLGLFNTLDNMGQIRSEVVAVELDTAMDTEFSDINDNHVGIDVNSLVSMKSAPAAYVNVGTASLINFSLVSGNLHQVWVEYDGASMRLEVTVVSPAGKPRPAVPLVSYTVNLSAAVADDTYIGFSGANGAASSSHYVLGWSFSLGGGRAPDLDLSKLPSIPSLRTKKTMPQLLIIIMFLVAVLVLLLVSGAVAVLVIRRRRFAEEQEDWEIGYGPHRISYKDLHAATRGFRDVIGAGGFGRVYHGVLPRSGTEVAVKKVSHESRQGLREFVSEIASMSRLRHRNLVQLLGYCRRRGELILVYDYMVNGSLDNHLFDADRPALSWEQRVKIVRDVAAGLLYLHEGWEQVVVHRDIKASNVLLDADMNGKLSDFGLARLYDHGSNPQTTHVIGTLGYLAPEMSKTGKATTSTDVFAFGAFLLEVACGRRPMERNDDLDSPGLVDLVLECWKAGRIMDAKDPKIGKCDEDDLELVLKLGLLCSHPDPRSRPSMRQVVKILEGAEAVPETPPKDLGSNNRLFYGYIDSFDEFATIFPTSETTVTTQPSSSHSNDELISG